MTIGAIYSTTTGMIQSTISPPLSNEAQIGALAAQGLAHMVVPDGTTGANAMIDLSNNTVATINAPPPIPNVMVQYVAAQINAGNLDPSAFHPSTLASMNTALTAASMTTVSTSAVSSSSNAAGAGSTS